MRPKLPFTLTPGLPGAPSKKPVSAWGPGVGERRRASSEALCHSRSTRRLSASSYSASRHLSALGITHSLLKLSLALPPSCPPSPGFLLPLWMVFPQLLRFSPCLKKRSPPPAPARGPLSSNCCPRADDCSTFIPGQTLPLALFLYLPTAPLRYHWARQTASRGHYLMARIPTVIPHLSDHAASFPHRNLVSPHLHRYIPPVIKCFQFSPKYRWNPSPLPSPLPWTRLPLLSLGYC